MSFKGDIFYFLWTPSCTFIFSFSAVSDVGNCLKWNCSTSAVLTLGLCSIWSTAPYVKKSIWDLLRTDSLIYFILIKTSFAKWVKISISLSKGRLILNCTICLYDFYVLFLHVLVNWYILVVNFLYSYAEYNLMNSIFNQIKIQDLCIWLRNTLMICQNIQVYWN